MHADIAETRGIAISARGGILIGLLLATAVILSGFSLVLGSHAVADSQTFPAWVDQRYAGEASYQPVPTASRTANAMVVANTAVGR